MLILAVKPTYIIFIVALIFIIQVIAALRCYKRCGPGEALVRTGFGGARVVFDHGLVIFECNHRVYFRHTPGRINACEKSIQNAQHQTGKENPPVQQRLVRREYNPQRILGNPPANCYYRSAR